MDYLVDVYHPIAQAASLNAIATSNYRLQLSNLIYDALVAGDTAALSVLRPEYEAYIPIAEQTQAIAELLRGMRPKILEIPIVDCSKPGDTPPPPAPPPAPQDSDSDLPNIIVQGERIRPDGAGPTVITPPDVPRRPTGPAPETDGDLADIIVEGQRADGSGGGARPPAEPKLPPPPLARPQFERVREVRIHDRFCSAVERNDFITNVYNPAAAAALANAQTAQTHQAKLNDLFTRYMRANSEYWGAVRTERDAYEAIAREALAESQTLNGLYPKIMAVPVVDCERRTETATPPAQTPAVPAQDVEPETTPTPQPNAEVPVPTPTPADKPKKPCPPKKTEGRDPITVGPNGKVGSGARLKSKLGGMALGALAGAAGLGGGGGGGGDGPDLWTCKIKDSEYTIFNDPASGLSIGVAAKAVKGGKTVVFTKIFKAPDKGTFQAAFLERPSTGQTIAPSDIGPCDLWGEWKLTVSWTKTTYVDGQLVKQESGGWSEGGLFRIPGMLSKVDEPDGLWKRMGFSNASNGAREMGAIFDVQPNGEPLTYVVHVTRPKGDPVTTVPFILTLTQGPDGKIAVTKAEEEPCPEEKTGSDVATQPLPNGGGALSAP